jgi:predicted MPP superfamily phosphohydrolase
MHCGIFNRGRIGIVSGGLGTSIIPLRFGPQTAPGWELVKIN